MTEFIAGLIIGFIVGAVAGMLFYRRHRDRLEAAADAARKM